MSEILSVEDCALLRRQCEAVNADLDRCACLEDSGAGRIDARRTEVRVMLAMLDTIDALRSARSWPADVPACWKPTTPLMWNPTGISGFGLREFGKPSLGLIGHRDGAWWASKIVGQQRVWDCPNRLSAAIELCDALGVECPALPAEMR